jgi:hypothetical protein
MLNQFVRRHLDSKSIDHSPPPIVTTSLQRTRQIEKRAIFRSTVEDNEILTRAAWPGEQFLPPSRAVERVSSLAGSPLGGPELPDLLGREAVE